MKAGKTGGFIMAAALATAGAVFAQGIDIQQVPVNAKRLNDEEPAVKPKNKETKDYQAEVLSNPAINDRARAEAIMHPDNNHSGGSAPIDLKDKQTGSEQVDGRNPAENTGINIEQVAAGEK